MEFIHPELREEEQHLYNFPRPLAIMFVATMSNHFDGLRLGQQAYTNNGLKFGIGGATLPIFYSEMTDQSTTAGTWQEQWQYVIDQTHGDAKAIANKIEKHAALMTDFSHKFLATMEIAMNNGIPPIALVEGEQYLVSDWNKSHPEMDSMEVFWKNIENKNVDSFLREHVNYGRLRQLRAGDIAYTHKGTIVEGHRPIFKPSNWEEKTQITHVQ